MSEADDRYDIAIFYNELIPEKVEAEFQNTVRHPKLRFVSKATPDRGPYAGIEWLLATGLILWIGKAYFNGFLSEAGKEHYHFLKKGIHNVWAKLVGPEKIVSIRVVTPSNAPKKVTGHQYSAAFSVIFPIGEHTKLKFLFSADTDETHIVTYVDRLTALIQELSTDSDYRVHILEKCKKCIIADYLIMAYDSDSNELVVLNPLTNKQEKFIGLEDQT